MSINVPPPPPEDWLYLAESKEMTVTGTFGAIPDQSRSRIQLFLDRIKDFILRKWYA